MRELLRGLTIGQLCWILAGIATALAVATGSAGAQGLDLSRLASHDPAARRIAVTIAPSIQSAADLSSPALIETRRRMARKQPVTIDALRALADAGDGIAALALARRFVEEQRRVRPENLAHYFGLAAATGRVGGLIGLTEVLDKIAPDTASPARMALLKRTVVAYARAGNPIAVDALLRFDRTGRPFGPLDEDLERLLTDARDAARTQIALHLASAALDAGWDDPTRLIEADRYLAVAETVGPVTTKAAIGNLRSLIAVRLGRTPMDRSADVAAATRPLDYGCFGLRTDPDLATVEGDNGTFYRLLQDVRMERPFSDRSVSQIADLSQALAQRGTTLVYAPVPTKAVAMPQNLPSDAHDMGFDLGIADAVHSDILARLQTAGVVVADLRTGLRRADPNRATFFETDTHWTPHGAELAAQAIADVLRAQPSYGDLPKTSYQTVEAGYGVGESVMRQILQTRCHGTLPDMLTMTYETVAKAATGSGLLDIGLDDAPLDIGLGDAGEAPLDIGLGGDAALDIFGTQAAGPQVAAVGTSFTNFEVSNFTGFLAQHSGLEVVNYAITGGRQYGALVSYLTSDEFQTAPPAFLVWEAPIYLNMAQTGDGAIQELIVAARGTCTRPIEIERTNDGRALVAALNPDLGPRDTLFLDTDTPSADAVAFHFWSDTDRLRTKTIRRDARIRRTGRFYMPLTGLWSDGASEVEITSSLPFGSNPTLFACTTNPA
ncbi:hypothetical protein JANAI62_20220 [Jannaschia pagri]|uniref:AlgX/AlgJ SGNH hydrolase-like domain-containing protein n=1 Tax=Jannaschia pagri TaxID=2829797 RepID=A0ABQ4NMF0_9RHOB|nr:MULTISPECIES: hypothetical protein [unclassified Jannaschia]GIT91565.1 hypothetical protein JANAI61_20230 [Jannaschia sp. AI_61]GIT95399.1 hypothetical protein JANAI62_20220 [Jannaschia sp. AI_62]